MKNAEEEGRGNGGSLGTDLEVTWEADKVTEYRELSFSFFLTSKPLHESYEKLGGKDIYT